MDSTGLRRALALAGGAHREGAALTLPPVDVVAVPLADAARAEIAALRVEVAVLTAHCARLVGERDVARRQLGRTRPDVASGTGSVPPPDPED